MKWNAIGIVTILCVGAVLVFTDRGEAATLAVRLLPIFVFVIGMSVVVNIAAKVGAFVAITTALESVAPRTPTTRKRVLWGGLMLLAVVSTIFLSLDTAAIMITPLAIAVARRNGLGLLPVALAVVWIANIGSLPLPVSNLTNLLALNGPVFASSFDYARQALLVGVAAIAVAIIAAWLVNRSTPTTAVGTHGVSSQQELVPDRLRTMSLIVLAVLVPLLASPIPYWLSTTVAAAVLLVATLVLRKDLVSFRLVPWSSLLLATVFSTVATTVNILRGASWVISLLGDFEETAAGLLGLAATGAGLSNLINNIPAYFALEPAVSSAAGYLALLVGTNAGAIVTPWASLATLLWHDQLVRAGVELKWRTYMAYGCVLLPFALVLPIGALILQRL